MWEKESVTVCQMMEIANDALVLQLHQFMLLLSIAMNTHKISLRIHADLYNLQQESRNTHRTS